MTKTIVKNEQIGGLASAQLISMVEVILGWNCPLEAFQD
jgi:hypothetical protein